MNKASSLSNFILFSIGFFLLAALPLTSILFIPNVRLIFFSVLAGLFCLVILGGAKLKAGKMFVIMTVFFVIVIISYPLSRAPEYAFAKLTLMTGYYFILPLIFINIVKIKKHEIIFIFGLLIGGLMLMLSAYYIYGSPYELIRSASRFYRFTLGEDANPIKTARYFGICVLAFVFFISYTKSFFLKLVFIIFSIISTMYVVSTGSKGPLIALIFGLLFFVFFAFKNRKTWIIVALIVLSFSGIAFMSLIPPEFITQRITIQAEGSGRLPVLLNTVSTILKSNIIELIIGHGLGDFGFYILGKDARSYPHNLFVELMYELGFLGLIVFIWWMVFPVIDFIKINKYKIDKVGGFVLSVYVFSIVNAQFSGDLPANLFIPVFAALLVAHNNIVKRSNNEKY